MEPHSLVNLGRRWYVLAWDRGRSDWRTFRVDRLSKPAPTGVRFTARKPPAKDAATYVAQSLSAAPHRYEARVTLHAPADAVRGQVPSAWGTIEPIDERSCEYRTGDDDLAWLALRVAMLGVEFEVREPPELVEHLRTLARRVKRATGGSRQGRDANLYMVLGTADRAGRPWASPVYYAHTDYREFLWVSKPEARHSRNLEAREAVSIVIFDSTVPINSGRAVYVSAAARRLDGDRAAAALAVYSRRGVSRRPRVQRRRRGAAGTPAPLRRVGAGRLRARRER